MHNLEIQQRIGLSAVMRGIEIDVLEAIEITKERYAGRSFCIVSEWVWVDLDAPDLVNEGLAAQGKKPVMLLAFNVLFDSMGRTNRASGYVVHRWLSLVMRCFSIPKTRSMY